jgi:hypothetical protein
MDSTKVLDRLDSLIDDLLIESDLPASSLASMLMAARDAVQDGYHVALARRVWDASNSIRDHGNMPLDYSLTAQDARGTD